MVATNNAILSGGAQSCQSGRCGGHTGEEREEVRRLQKEEMIAK